MIWSSAYRQWEMLDMGYEENTVLLQCNHLRCGHSLPEALQPSDRVEMTCFYRTQGIGGIWGFTILRVN